MTNVVILGEEKPEKEKPIEFVKNLAGDLTSWITTDMPNEWQNIILLCRCYRLSDFDLMFAYDDDRSCGCLYLGHFNSGKVEE
jgi:hypothetical protein